MGPHASHAHLLAETGWLAEHLADPSIRIVDIGGIIKPPDAPHPHYYGNRSAYLEAHMPGAVFVDWTADITEPGAPVKMEVTVEHQRKQAAATVAKLPFFDPQRKKA